MENSHILFAGWGDLDVAGVCHYRTKLPAATMDAECVVFTMNGEGVWRTGTNMKHEIIVVQHGWEHWQIRVARNMAKSGAKVIVNCDDWLPKVAKMGTDHALSWHFKKDKRIDEWRNLLREAHGVLCSTQWLADRVRTINPNVAVARNGLDLGRYERHRQPKEGSAKVLGWAGGTGHEGSFKSIVPAIEAILDTNPETRFLAVGDPVGRFIGEKYQDRVGFYKWSDMDLYPINMAEFDISLAPAMNNDFFRAKSQLRFYEACAMGTPTVGDPLVYDEIQPLVTGMKPRSIDEWVEDIQTIIDHPPIYHNMRSECLSYCEEIDIKTRIAEWTIALKTLTSS